MHPPSISVTIKQPLATDTGIDFGSYTIQKYGHDINVFGGFESANFTISDVPLDIEDWLYRGLGADIKVYSDALTSCWEGFVNIIKAQVGALTITIGPLMDMANRVAVMYNGVENVEYPAITIGQVRTTEKNDTTSQGKYGILPKILSASDCTTEEADGYAGTYLDKKKNPKISQDWSSTKKGTPQLELDCLGYQYWLDFPYDDSTVGDQSARLQIIDILAATPNIAWLVFDTNHIDPDGDSDIVATVQENDNQTGLSKIKSITSFGDSVYNRWLFGVYEDFKAYYYQAPTEVEYRQNLGDASNRIYTPAGGLVYPWNIRPGKWIEYADILIGEAIPADLNNSMRFQFIESVKYTAPWGLQLKGGEVDTLAQRMAQFGLGGTS